MIADVVHADNVRVVQGRGELRFALEPKLPVLARDTGGEELDRDGSIQAHVRGAKHLAHAPRAQRRDDLVRPDSSAGVQHYFSPVGIENRCPVHNDGDRIRFGQCWRRTDEESLAIARRIEQSTAALPTHRPKEANRRADGRNGAGSDRHCDHRSISTRVEQLTSVAAPPRIGPPAVGHLPPAAVRRHRLHPHLPTARLGGIVGDEMHVW